jgi:hypothetical protein
MPALTGTSDKLRAKIEADNESAAAAAAILSATNQDRADEILAAAESDDDQAVAAVFERQQDEKPAAAQKLVKAWDNRRINAEAMRDEMRAAVEPANSIRDEVFAKAEKDLRKIGFSPEGMTIFRDAPEVAKRQFAQVVASHPKCRSAAAEAADAANRFHAAQAQVKRSIAGKRAAQEYLLSLAMKQTVV